MYLSIMCRIWIQKFCLHQLLRQLEAVATYGNGYIATGAKHVEDWRACDSLVILPDLTGHW